MTFDEIAQENLLLVQENVLLRAMQENAILARENMVLRMQSERWLTPMQSMPQMRLSTPTDVLKTSSGSKRSSKACCSSGDVSTTTGSNSASPLSLSRSSSGTDSNPSKEKSEVAYIDIWPHQDDRTSVMMCNLPNSFTRKMLLDLMNTEGFAGCFDFVYLPIDFQSNSGLGYAFVTLVCHEVATRFCQHFTGFNQWNMASEKICKVTWSDAIQGLEAHIERYRNSPVMHESVPEDHRPLLFSGSEEIPFPAPSKKIRAPRRWHRRH